MAQNATEFAVKCGTHAVLFMEPVGVAAAAVMKRLERHKGVQVVQCRSPLDAFAVVRQLEACLVIGHARHAADINQYLMFLKFVAQVPQKRVRMVVTDGVRDDDLIARLSIAGCTEVLPDSTTAKSLLFKIDRHLKVLPQNTGDFPAFIEMPPLLSAPPVVPPPVRPSAQPESPTQIKWADALKIESDCWILAGAQPRMTGEVWVLRMRGPAPDLGNWVQVDSSAEGLTGSKDSQELWQWRPGDPENDPFVVEQGAWLFRGNRPEYRGGHWTFAANAPSLGFYYQGRCYGRKIALEDPSRLKVLTVAKDSEQSAKLLEMIKAAADQDGEVSEQSLEKSVAPATSRTVGPHLIQVDKGQLAPDSKSQDPVAAQLLPKPLRVPDKSPRISEIGKVYFVDPLVLRSDCWLLQGRRPQWDGAKWIVKLTGPGPGAGRWTSFEVVGQTLNAQTFWQWKPASEQNDPFIREQGFWLFVGAQPIFGKGVWTFEGASADLSFFCDGQKYGSKFGPIRGGGLAVARDSVAAQSALPKIFDSYEMAVIEERKAKGIAVPPRKPIQDDAVDHSLDGAEDPFEPKGSGVQEFRYPVDHFNPQGGKWQRVSSNVDGIKTCVFVTPQMEGIDEPSLRALGAFWVYKGRAVPKRVGKQWVTLEVEPKFQMKFDKLDRPVQEFLLSLTAGARESVLSSVTNARRAKREALEAAERQKAEAERVANALRKAQERAARLTHLDESQEKPSLDDLDDLDDSWYPDEEFGQAPPVDAGADQTPPPIEAAPALDDSLDDLPLLDEVQEAAPPFRARTDLAAVQAPALAEDTSLDDLEDEAPVAEAGDEAVSAASVDEEPAQEVEKSTAELPSGPQSVAATQPPGPTLSPLALAFLLSELMNREGVDISWMSHRYCTYLSASCGGLRAELWVCGANGKAWSCAGTPDQEAGWWEGPASGAAGLSQAKTAAGDSVPVLVTQIRAGTSAPLGALVLSGQGAEKVDPKYAQAAVRMAYGMLLSLREKVA